MATAILSERSQPSRGRATCQFSGPDTYVSVQIIPAGQYPLVCLNKKVAKKRGIILVYCGEGYSNRTGPTSMLGKAREKGKRIVKAIEEV